MQRLLSDNYGARLRVLKVECLMLAVRLAIVGKDCQRMKIYIEGVSLFGEDQADEYYVRLRQWLNCSLKIPALHESGLKYPLLSEFILSARI